MRRQLEVEMAGVASLVRGHGSRELLESVTGRPPIWSHARKGWSCQQDTARDVVALAECRNYDVVMVGSKFTKMNFDNSSGEQNCSPEQTPAPESGGGLW